MLDKRSIIKVIIRKLYYFSNENTFTVSKSK